MRDLKSGFLLFCLSLFVLWASLEMGMGTWHKPGPGFLSFYVGIVVTVLSLNLIRKGWRIRESQGVYSGRVTLALVSTIVYSLVLEPLGFIVSTFFLLGIFFHLGEPRQWWLIIGMSGLVTILVYLAFGVLLQVPLPRGFMGI